jgi:hypothetical protein
MDWDHSISRWILSHKIHSVDVFGKGHMEFLPGAGGRGLKLLIKVRQTLT